MIGENITQKELNSYYRKIGTLLTCTKVKKAEIMQSVKTMTEDFIAESKPKNFRELTEHLGTPEAVAASFCEVSPEYIKKKLSIKRAVIIALSAIVAIVAIFFVAVFLDAKKSIPAYSVGYIQEESTFPQGNLTPEIYESIVNKSE